MAKLAHQIRELKKLQQNLASFPSSENADKLMGEIEAAMMVLNNKDLPREFMNKLVKNAKETLAKLAIQPKQPIKTVKGIAETKLETRPAADRVEQKPTKRKKRVREAKIEDFSAEEKALKEAERAWNVKNEIIKDTFSLVKDDQFKVTRSLPEAKEYLIKIDNMQVQFDNLVKRQAEEIQAAAENYPLAWESKKTIKLRNGQMMADQSALYKAHLEELNALHTDLNRLTGTLFLIRENASNSSLVEAMEKYAIAKQTASEMHGDFSRYNRMAQHPNETINAIHRNIELRMENALERSAAAQKIVPNLNQNDATSTLAQIEKYTAAANAINSITVELVEAKGWLSQQLNSIAPAIEQEIEESRVSDRHQQILKEMETYLQSEAVALYLQAKDDHTLIDATSKSLRKATTTQSELSKKVKKIDALRTELAGINFAIQAKTFSSDIEYAVHQRKGNLKQYEEKINEIASSYAVLQEGISTSLSDLKQLGEEVEKEWLAILDQNNTTLKELQALTSPDGKASVADLTDVIPNRGEGRQGIKEQIDAFTDLHEEKKEQITTLQNQISKELELRVNGRIDKLNEWLKTPSLSSPLITQLETAKAALEKMKGAVSLPELKQLHTNLLKFDDTLKTLKTEVARHQRVMSPEYQALDGLGKGIELEKERLIVKYMGEAMHKFYEHVKANPNLKQENLQAIYNSFHELEEKYQLQLHGPDEELRVFRARFEKGDPNLRSPRIYNFIDPRLEHLEDLSQCVEKHKSAFLDVANKPSTVIAAMKSDLDKQLLPEKIQDLSEKRRGKLVQFITQLASVFLPSHLLQTKAQRNLTEITQSFKQKLGINERTENPKMVLPQNKISRKAVENTILKENKNMTNASWRNFLTNCLDFENIEPETKFIKLPLQEQMKKAQMIANFDNFDDLNSMKSAVACVLKAMCTPAKSDSQFADTSAMQQFVERFNSGKITGDVKEILYEIVSQKSGGTLKVEDFTKKEKEITQLSEAAIEHGFDSQSALQQVQST